MSFGTTLDITVENVGDEVQEQNVRINFQHFQIPLSIA